MADVTKLSESPGIQNYLEESTILIVDQTSSARVGLKKALVGMGADLGKIKMAATLEEAEIYVRQNDPCILLCDFQVGNRYTLDLMQGLRKDSQLVSKIFILITANTSQSAVAQAAEEDVDAYVLKPYTLDGLRAALLTSIKNRVQPSAYLSTIAEGKKLVETNSFAEAKLLFSKAMSLDSKPALACFYEGFCFGKVSEMDSSEGSYQKGLGFNKIHYKCLVGLFDLLIALNRPDAAYEVVKKIVRYFPSNPKRLASVLRLAIQTKNYSDVDAFYNAFLQIDSKSDELIKCVCAAMIVSAKYFFENNDIEHGVIFLRNASISAGGNRFLLLKIIEALAQYDQVSEAEKTLERFTDRTLANAEYHRARLAIYEKKSAELMINEGLVIINNGLIDLAIVKKILVAMKAKKMDARFASLIEMVKRQKPELGDELDKVA